MLNILDILVSYKDSLNNKLNSIDSMVEKFMDNFDFISIISEVNGVKNISAADEDFTGTDEELMADIGQAVYDSMNGITIIDDDGNVLPITVTHTNDYTSGTIYTGSGIQCGFWGYNSLDEKYEYVFTGLSDKITNVGGIIENLANVSGVNNIISVALDLLQQGNLTIESFMASIPDYVNNANGNVKMCINMIRQSINSCSVNAQAASLYQTIKLMFGDISNATAIDDGVVDVSKIDFNSTDYTITSSMFLPLDSAISLASTVLSAVLTFVKPVLGVAVSLVGQGVAKVVELVDKNDTAHFKFISPAERDNDCFAVPVLQKEMSISFLPSQLQAEVNEHGFCKLINGWLTLYIWKSDANDVKIEGYLSAKCDIEYNTPETSDFIQTVLAGLMNYGNGATDHISLGIGTYTLSNFNTNVNAWLNDLSHPGASAPDYNDNPSYGAEQKDALAFRRVGFSYLLLLYLYVSVLGTTAGYDYNVILGDILNDGNKRMIDFTDLQYAVGCAARFESLLTNKHLNVWDGFGYARRATLAQMVNDGIPALRALFANLTGTQWKNMLDSWNFTKCDFTGSLSSLGLTSNFIITYSVCNKANSYVIPPTSTFSTLTQAIFTAAVVVGIAVTAIIIRAKIRKAIQFKAAQKRAEIDSNMQRFKDSGGSDYASWNKARILDRRYNRTFGVLTGTSYDFNNGWINSRSLDSDTISALAPFLKPFASTAGTKAVMVVADPTVYKVITGQDLNLNE